MVCWWPGFIGMVVMGLVAVCAGGCGVVFASQSCVTTPSLREEEKRRERECDKRRRRRSPRSLLLLALAAVLSGAVVLTAVRISHTPAAREAVAPQPGVGQPRRTARGARRACACRTMACLRAAFARMDSRGRSAAFKVPHFWLGGGQKCGTTSMYELLARHPQILPPTPKEPGFFAWPAVARAATQRWYVKDVLRLREACERGLRVATFDATAYYLQWGSAVGAALRQSAPWALAVLVLREPIARAMSWLQHMALKFARVPSCLHWHSMDCCVEQSWFLGGVHHLGGSLYHKAIQEWLSVGWSLERMHIARFEDVVERGLPAVYADILQFLGLDLSPAHNLSAQQSAPVNRRSAAPYNVSRGAYRAMVDVVREDVQQLEQLTGRDWGWPRLWRRQLAQCDRDKVCYVNLVPTKDPDTPL